MDEYVLSVDLGLSQLDDDGLIVIIAKCSIGVVPPVSRL